MGDIYTLFPKLKGTCIPEGVGVPPSLLRRNGVGTFITDLQAQVKKLETSGNNTA